MCVSFLEVQQRRRAKRREVAKWKRRRDRRSGDRDDFLDAEVGRLEVDSVNDAKGYPQVGVVLPDNDTPEPDRSKRRDPTARSSRATAWLTAGCPIPRCTAALVKEPSRAVASKARSPESEISTP